MEPRNVSLLIGKKSYNLITSLDNDELKEVSDLLIEAMPGTNSSLTQDELLFIAGMTLAGELAAISKKAERMLGEFQDTGQKEEQ